MVDLEKIVKLSKENIKSASLVLSRAFYNDPEIAWQIPDETKRRDKLHHLWIMILKLGMKYGEVYAPSENLEGVAIWYPPNHFERSTWRYIINGGFNLLFKIGSKSIKKLMFCQAVKDSIRKAYMKFPYWYVETLGIDPNYQGKGYASKLLKPMVKRIDNENVLIYLDTNQEKNVSFYEHFGFTILEEIIIPKTNIVNWSMIRISEL